MPIIAYNLIFMIDYFSSAMRAFADKCISGIKPNLGRIKSQLAKNLSIVTALSPVIGYSKAAEVAREAYLTDKTIKEVCLERKIMAEEELDRLLDPKRQV
jgi:fumarate hydratase class II